MTKRKLFHGKFPSETVLQKQMANGIDIYKNFINKTRLRTEKELKKNQSVYLETHHILPRHAGGSDSEQNQVPLTFNDHVIAHFVRWIANGDPKDKTAYLVMSGQTEDIRLEIARLGGTLGGPKTQLFLKENKKGWFNNQN